METWVLLVFRLLLFVQTGHSKQSCQPVTVDFCQDVGYNTTINPTHQTRDYNLRQLRQIVNTGCSPEVTVFLCGVVSPECVLDDKIPPCSWLCERVKNECEPFLREKGLNWPEKIRCEAYPKQSCANFGVTSAPSPEGPCQPITMPLCQGISYNLTAMPNLLGHKKQAEAAVKMAQLEYVLKLTCSVDIRFFLCSVYAPQCVEGEVQRPCRSLCERATLGCDSVLNTFGMSWPDDLSCESFPEESCVRGDSNPEQLTAEELLVKLNELGHSVRDQSLSLQTAHILLALEDKDKSGKLDVKEFHNLKHYVSVTKREYSESYEWQNPGFVTEYQMKNALDVRDLSLDDETFKTLWDRYSSGGGIKYDDFMAILTRLKILKARFKSRLISPCDAATDCEVASFSFSQLIQVTIM
ncbi:uncharacterized protein [Salvelinus sp. IW2-2015]|uniref:uncharacterized protein isoform X3 n=1 Tax=Salvelinus sp. IW2-2015 TaxID=2691554 RepID=UPI0038D44218